MNRRAKSAGEFFITSNAKIPERRLNVLDRSAIRESLFSMISSHDMPCAAPRLRGD